MGITTRQEIEKELLVELYVNQKMSSIQIAKQIGCMKRTVLLRMKDYGIPRRNLKEAFKVSESHGNWPDITKHPAYKNGRKKQSGYIMVKPDFEHPRCKSNEGYVFEHILVAEKTIGRFLKQGEEVHHKNGIRTDNRPENKGGSHGRISSNTLPA
jgi:hypothetical protein